MKKKVTPKILNKTQKRVFVAGGSRLGNNPIYEKEVYALGKEIGKQNYQLSFGLSSRGIMGAVAKGVLESWSDKTRKPIKGITTDAYLKRYDTEKELEKISEIVVAHTLEERKTELLKSITLSVDSGLSVNSKSKYNTLRLCATCSAI